MIPVNGEEVIIMKFTPIARWMLANQYRILEALYPDEAEALALRREALECGYELHYERLAECLREQVVSAEICQEALDILEMCLVLQRAYQALAEPRDIPEHRLAFRGFDGNNEEAQLAYCRYVFRSDPGRLAGLEVGDQFNSHRPMLGCYRRMLQAWKRCANRYLPTKEDLLRIALAWERP
jgi:uncharacterized protein YfbU (UPF0304 family)